MVTDPSDPNVGSPVLMLYDVKDAVAAYVAEGFAAKQIIVGMPIYGRMVTVTQFGDDHYGLYQPLASATPPQGEYDDAQSGNTGVFDYSCIVRASACKLSGAALLAGIQIAPAAAHAKYANNSLSQWAYIPNKNAVITFDDAVGIAAKAQWAKQYGGAMFWSLSGDLPADDQDSLVNAAYNSLKS
jgi:GH18 family chitinase